LNILSLNCRSIRSVSKRNQLVALLDLHDIDIVLGTESHIDQTFLSSEILPKAYKLLRKDRCLGGGGVFIAFKQHLHILEETSLAMENEMLWAKLVVGPNHDCYYFCSFYRPPDTNFNPIIGLQQSLTKLQQNKTDNPAIFLTGDFNLPSIEWNDGCGMINPTPQYGYAINELLVDVVNDNSLEQLIQEPTRENHTLDLLFCSDSSITTNIQIVPGISDHDAICFQINLSSHLPTQQESRYPVYLYHKTNINGLKHDIEEFQQHFLISDPYSKPLEDNWLNFKSAINQSINQNIPQRLSKSRKDLPWITHPIRTKMRLRKNLYNKAKRVQTAEAWSDYRKLRNEINNEIKCRHEAYQNNLFNGENANKNFWKYIKALRKDPTGNPPFRLQNQLVTDAKEKADALNNQFYSVFTDEDLSDIPECNDDKMNPNVPLITFSEDGIKHQLSTLDTQKAPGPDCIPAYVLHHCAAEIAPILTVIFSQSLNTGEVPSDWLRANVVPVFKKGDRHDPSNYRPISLTSICCKVMEHILCHSIMKHLEENQILSNFQYGFRPAHSCEAQLITLTEEIHHALDCRHQVDLIMLDFSKAFDTVPHSRLLRKLKHYGINGKLHDWLTTWLTKRTQQVVIDGQTSASCRVKSGVPQGTVLGPIMFLVYINDIGQNVTSGIQLFADDCILYRIIKSPHDEQALQEDLTRVSNWANIWQMRFNVNKCVVLRCSRLLSQSQPRYLLENQPLHNVTEHLFLGVTLDSRLSFSTHIKLTSAKATKTFNFIRRNLHRCSRSTKAKAYSSMVRPILEYCSTVWDPHILKDVNELEKVQRRSARWVMSDYNWSSSVTSMLNLLQWPTLTNRRLTARLHTFYKSIYHLTAVQLPPYFSQTQRSTRQYHPLHFIIPSTNCDYYKYSFFPRTIREWNDLPNDLIESNSLPQFKAKLQALINPTFD